MTPSRMKSCRDIDVAMNSIAQHASPKMNTQREYRRPQLSTNLIGFGASREAGPMRGSGRSTAPMPPFLRVLKLYLTTRWLRIAAMGLTADRLDGSDPA